MTDPILYATGVVRCRNCDRTQDGITIMPCPERAAGKCHQEFESHPPVPYDPSKHGVSQS